MVQAPAPLLRGIESQRQAEKDTQRAAVPHDEQRVVCWAVGYLVEEALHPGNHSG